MYVRFVTTGTDHFANFKANIKINDCGGTYYIPYMQELKLPNYPNNYTDNMECNIYLRAYSASNYYEMNITSMDIPANSDCTAGDYIEFREESATGELIGRYCGSINENNTISFNSKGSVVYITFKSDTSRTGRGLKLSVRTLWSSK
jgi:cubilin